MGRPGLPFHHPAMLIATWFGAGFLPLTPGSWGSLAALPVAWAIDAAGGRLGLAIAAAGLFVIGCWAASVVAARSGLMDPGIVVVDEVVGQWTVLLAARGSAAGWAAAFVLFRLFDILKPWPVGWADARVHGGFGIMLDDLLAAIYAIAVLWGLHRISGI